MELTFLKLVGSRTTGGRERERGGGEEAGKRNVEAKKIEAPERVGWTGIMAVLELHYQSSVPSAPRHHLTLRALRSTPFHSIPPLFHPLGLPWKLSRYHTPLLVPGKTPPSNTALPKPRCRASPVPTFLAHDAPFPWMYMHGILPSRLPPSRIHLSEHLYCILYNVHAFSYQIKLFWWAARLALMDRLWYTLRNILRIES